MFERQVDCIVRLHNPKRLLELGRCVFSLVGQTYRPLNIILTVQRFSGSNIKSLREALRPVLSLPGAPTLDIINWQAAEPTDARTELLNRGLRVCSGQYVGFLDYDDVLYPEAYELLVGRLKTTQAAIAFASTRLLSANIYNGFVYANSRIIPPFHGENLSDLFRANFCPIHSYLIDRSKLECNELSFDTALTWEEDYDMLLRVCSAHSSDFGLLGKEIGDYYYKTDGSNTVPQAPLSEDRLAEYNKVRAVIEARRQTTLIASVVQKQLGFVKNDPQMTIRDALSRL